MEEMVKICLYRHSTVTCDCTAHCTPPIVTDVSLVPLEISSNSVPDIVTVEPTAPVKYTVYLVLNTQYI